MTAMVHVPQGRGELQVNAEFSREQVELVKRTIAKGATDDELKLFISTAQRLKLDPFARQIFAIKRWDPETKDMGMTTHVAIDGLRLIADRTGEYLPAEDLPEFRYNGKGELVAAVVYVQKLKAGAWHKIPAVAFFDEYAQRKRDGGLTKNWAEKPHIMLGKCAEALAIRKAFPNETSGVYVPEEFEDAEYTESAKTITPPPPVPPQPKSSAPPPPAPPPSPPPAKGGPGPAVRAAEPRANRNEAQLASDRREAARHQAEGTAAVGPPAPTPEVAEGAEYFDQETRAKAATATPASAAAEVEAAAPTLLDEIVAELQMAKTLAEYKTARKRVDQLRGGELESIKPHLLVTLLSLVEEAPVADLDAVMALLGKARGSDYMTPESLARAEEVFRDRTMGAVPM